MIAALELKGLSKSFGALRANDDIDLSIREHECHAIIGPNGAGKSTLIGLLTGEILPDRGQVLLFGEDITHWSVPRRALAGLGRSFQITQIVPGFSALDNVALAVQGRSGHSFQFVADARADMRLRAPAIEALEQVGLSARADVMSEILSHGERRQLELAMALALKPRVLLLDEPMAGMGPQESALMVQRLIALKGQVTIVLIEHDMDVVFALADRVSVLVAGQVLTSGTPDEVRADRRVRAAYLGGEVA